MKQKVLIYVLRPAAGVPEVLVFVHRDYPEAGVQVPAGTVEPGEDVTAAAHRELVEESGLGPERVRLVRKLTDHPEPEWDQHRHVFVFEPLVALPDTWSHTVHGGGDDAGMVFDFNWLPATPTLTLAGDQHARLPLALQIHREGEGG
jgi:8-oxo-dGTP pyrophosphatase MutT (NUDIX family)